MICSDFLCAGCALCGSGFCDTTFEDARDFGCSCQHCRLFTDGQCNGVQDRLDRLPDNVDSSDNDPLIF